MITYHLQSYNMVIFQIKLVFIFKESVKRINMTHKCRPGAFLGLRLLLNFIQIIIRTICVGCPLHVRLRDVALWPSLIRSCLNIEIILNRPK